MCKKWALNEWSVTFVVEFPFITLFVGDFYDNRPDLYLICLYRLVHSRFFLFIYVFCI